MKASEYQFSRCRVKTQLISLDGFDFMSFVSRNWRDIYDDFAVLSGNVISIQNEKMLMMSMKLCADVGREDAYF